MHVAVVGQGLLSRGGECVLFGQLDRGSRLEPVIVDELWERKPMRPAVGLEEVAAWVAGCGVTCRTSRRLIMISHPWSGVVQIHDLGRRYILDLYNEQTRLIVLDAVYEIVVDVTRLATIRGRAASATLNAGCPLAAYSRERGFVFSHAIRIIARLCCGGGWRFCALALGFGCNKR